MNADHIISGLSPRDAAFLEEAALAGLCEAIIVPSTLPDDYGYFLVAVSNGVRKIEKMPRDLRLYRDGGRWCLSRGHSV